MVLFPKKEDDTMSDKETIYGGLNEQQKTASLPYYVHEGEMTRMERVNRRWFIAFLVVLVMLFATNAGWIVYESQFETYEVEQDIDTGIGSAYVAGVGDVNYGQNQTSSEGASAQEQQPEPAEDLP